MDNNPYASSKVDSRPTAAPQLGYRYIWRDGQYLVARNNYAEFPPRCLICGNDDCRILRCTVRKPPGFLLVVWPVALAFAPYVTAKPYFCPVHRSSEMASRWFGRVLLTIAFGLFVGPLAFMIKTGDAPVWAAIAAACSLPVFWGWAAFRILRTRIVWAKHIVGSDAWIERVHASVLADLQPVSRSQ